MAQAQGEWSSDYRRMPQAQREWSSDYRRMPQAQREWSSDYSRMPQAQREWSSDYRRMPQAQGECSSEQGRMPQAKGNAHQDKGECLKRKGNRHQHKGECLKRKGNAHQHKGECLKPKGNAHQHKGECLKRKFYRCVAKNTRVMPARPSGGENKIVSVGNKINRVGNNFHRPVNLFAPVHKKQVCRILVFTPFSKKSFKVPLPFSFGEGARRADEDREGSGVRLRNCTHIPLLQRLYLVKSKREEIAKPRRGFHIIAHLLAHYTGDRGATSTRQTLIS